MTRERQQDDLVEVIMTLKTDLNTVTVYSLINHKSEFNRFFTEQEAHAMNRKL